MRNFKTKFLAFFRTWISQLTTIIWRMRIVIKSALCRWITVIEFCNDCGREVPIVWQADASNWNAVVDKDVAVLCPQCFDRRALAKGFFLRWRPTIERVCSNDGKWIDVDDQIAGFDTRFVKSQEEILRSRGWDFEKMSTRDAQMLEIFRRNHQQAIAAETLACLEAARKAHNESPIRDESWKLDYQFNAALDAIAARLPENKGPA